MYVLIIQLVCLGVLVWVLVMAARSDGGGGVDDLPLPVAADVDRPVQGVAQLQDGDGVGEG
jgi:hypothetical protein